MATSAIANRILQHGLQITKSVEIYIISSGMFVFGVIVQRTNLQIMSLLKRNTPGRITTNLGRSVMATPREPIPNSRHAMFTEDSTWFDIFPVSWPTSRSLTSSIQCRWPSLTTSRRGFSTSGKCMNSSTCTMQSGHQCLLTTTSHQKKSHMRKFLNGMGRRWRKWAGTCLEL